MPGPAPTPLVPDQTLPARADVVIIGGGIVGVSAALDLAERGYRVLVCEKGGIGCEQSSRNWGWVRLSLRDPREIPLMIHAIGLWQDLDRRIGRNTGYSQAGIVFGAATAAQLAGYEAWSARIAGAGTGARILTGRELGRLLPGCDLRFEGGFLTPQDGRAEPQLAAPAIAEGARDRGATIVTRCAVRSVDLAAGRICAVETELGRVGCDAVLLAGGAWSRLFAGNAGIALPQLGLLSTAMRTGPVDDAGGPALWSDEFALRKRADGGYTVASGHQTIVDIVPDTLRLARAFWPALRQEWSALRFRLSSRFRGELFRPRRWRADRETPFESCRVLDPAPDPAIRDRAWQAACAACPALGDAGIRQVWAGMIDVTPDAIPVISPVGAVPGLFMATGFSGHGFGIAPAAGRLAADLVTGTDPLVDPHPFRFSRFADGSPVILQTGL